MDAWEWNKIAAAVFAVAVFVLAVHLAADAIFYVAPPAKPGYIPAQPVAAGAPGGPSPAADSPAADGAPK